MVFHEEDDFEFSSSQPVAPYPPHSGGWTWGCTTSLSSPQHFSSILGSHPGAGAATCPPPPREQAWGWCTTSSSSPPAVSFSRSPPRRWTSAYPHKVWGRRLRVLFSLVHHHHYHHHQHHHLQKTEDLNFLLLGGSGKIFGLILLPQFLMVIIFKIWQIIIFSSKFSLNWAISSVFIFYFIFH